MKPLTKTEAKILELVKNGSSSGYLVGLATDPTCSDYTEKKHRFIKSLADRGLILYIRTSILGSGWVIRDGEVHKYLTERNFIVESLPNN
jgi:hypothetical protein